MSQQPPSDESAAAVPGAPLDLPPSRAGQIFAVAGSVCMLAPLAGLSITVLSMVRSFSQLARDGEPPSREGLSHSIADAMAATAIGYTLSVLGLCLACIAIFGFRYTPPCLRSALIGGLLLWLIAFPHGLIFAAIVAGILIKKHQAFAATSRAKEAR